MQEALERRKEEAAAERARQRRAAAAAAAGSPSSSSTRVDEANTGTPTPVASVGPAPDPQRPDQPERRLAASTAAAVPPSQRPRQRPRRPPVRKACSQPLPLLPYLCLSLSLFITPPPFTRLLSPQPPPSEARRISQAAIERERAQADELLDELGRMASALKHEAHGMNQELAGQTRVLDRLGASAGDVAARVASQSVRMQKRYRRQASSCWASWMQLVLLAVAFFFAVLVMRILPAQVSLIY